MPSQPLATADVLSLLAAAPQRIAELTATATPVELRAAPAPGEWSAAEVLAHLRACADIWGGCIAALLAQDAPMIRAVNPTTWIDSTDYRALDFQPSFEAFAAQRTALLAVLEPLAPEAWTRAGTVTGAGRPLVRTVHSYAQRLAVHERSHVKEIARLVQTLHTAR